LEHAPDLKEFSNRSSLSGRFRETPEKSTLDSITRSFKTNGTHFAFICGDATHQAEKRARCGLSERNF
jgi:hypothetical protein